MKRTGFATVLTLSALIFGATIVGCGDDDSTTAGSAEPAATQTTGQGGNGTGSAPASAYDKPDKDAPDNAISDRPGGPNDQ